MPAQRVDSILVHPDAQLNHELIAFHLVPVEYRIRRVPEVFEREVQIVDPTKSST